MASVKSTRLRRSGTRKMFASFSNILRLLLLFLFFVLDCRSHKDADHFGLAARFLHLLLGRLGKFMGMDRKRRFQIAIAQHFDKVILTGQAMLEEHIEGDLLFAEFRKPLKIEDRIFSAENVGKTALRQ